MIRYSLEATILQGKPRVTVVDAAGEIRFDWHYTDAVDENPMERERCSPDHFCVSRTNLQQLLKGLFLLSCVAKLESPRDTLHGCDCT